MGICHFCVEWTWLGEEERAAVNLLCSMISRMVFNLLCSTIFRLVRYAMVWNGMISAEFGFGTFLLDAVDVDVDFFVVEAELWRSGGLAIVENN